MSNESKMRMYPLVLVTPTWEDIIKRINKTQDLSEDLKARGLEAVEVFRKTLGQRFFTNTGYDHPLQQKWGNMAPWQVAQLSEWAIVLEQLHHTSEGGIYLTELLKRRDKCREEGIPFLKIAASLQRVGFTVEFLRATANSKSPDIKVIIPQTGETFYVEVTHLQKNDTFKKDERNFHLIDIACLRHAPFLLTSVKILRPMTEEEAERAASSIATTAQAVYKQKKLQVHVDETIAIAFAPEQEESAFEEWLKAENRSKGIWGIEINPDETQRITQRGRIKKKAKQIPQGATGIIFMKIEFLYFSNFQITHVISEIKKAMIPYPQLKGIVLYCEVLDPRESEIIEWDGQEDLFSIYCVNGNVTLSLYCANDQYSGEMSPSATDLFRKSLMPPEDE